MKTNTVSLIHVIYNMNNSYLISEFFMISILTKYFSITTKTWFVVCAIDVDKFGVSSIKTEMSDDRRL